MIVEVHLSKEDGLIVENVGYKDYVSNTFAQITESFPEYAQPYQLVNRNAVLVIPKKPFYHWLNALYPDDPIKEYHIQEHNIYLIHEVGDESAFESWLEANYVEIFEHELFMWHTDSEDWPDCTLPLFKKWFRVQMHSMVIDFENDHLTKD